MLSLYQCSVGARITTSCAVSAVENARGCLIIFESGTPLTELGLLSRPSGLPEQILPEKPQIPLSGQKNLRPNERSLGAINFVRTRMFHARAALNAKGKIKFGLRHIRELRNNKLIVKAEFLIDVLNRYRDFDNYNHTIHVMKYMFPRQFGLHNVFTSSVDARETVQPFKDYTLREQEIALHQRQKQVKNSSLTGSPKVRLPKRLRGQAVALVKKLQKLHSRCSYTELLKHYCPYVGA